MLTFFHFLLHILDHKNVNLIEWSNFQPYNFENLAKIDIQALLTMIDNKGTIHWRRLQFFMIFEPLPSSFGSF